MLNITENNEIIVPKGVRYINEWTDYSLNDFPFPHILDKKIPGCGFTEYAITCNIPTITISPRRILIKNKLKQHPGEVFYFSVLDDEDLGTDKDLAKDPSKRQTNKTATQPNKTEESDQWKEALSLAQGSLRIYILERTIKSQAPKILVTYDSFRLLKEFLEQEGTLGNFHIIVDEFQSIFTDSRFKSSTEMEFVWHLQSIQKVCFVSATPMIDKYLKKIPEFASLPYYELDWTTDDPLRAIKPDLKVRTMASVNTTAKEIIDKYKAGNYEFAITPAGPIASKEAVFYVNSINNILGIIKASGLTPEECNILCANTYENSKRIKARLGSGFSIGDVPLQGEPHKMFTFCTRTVYLGADFYSDNARSFILSDANIESLAVDISLDLPQILGRQRLNTNPWKNRAEFYYKSTLKVNKMTEEDFKKIIDEKLKTTSLLLNGFNDIRSGESKFAVATKYERDAKNSNYRFDYVAVNHHAGSTLLPVLNNLVQIAEERAFDIQQTDYKDRFTVFNTLGDLGLMKTDISRYLIEFSNLSSFREKMRYICETSFTPEERSALFDQVPIIFKNYYEQIGPARLRALSYNTTKIKKEVTTIEELGNRDLVDKIYSSFSEGSRYTKPFIKETLKNIYSYFGSQKTPKATDLGEWFEIKNAQVVDPESGKIDKGFLIIKKK